LRFAFVRLYQPTYDTRFAILQTENRFKISRPDGDKGRSIGSSLFTKIRTYLMLTFRLISLFA
jgi:hypothetical protein